MTGGVRGKKRDGEGSRRGDERRGQGKGRVRGKKREE